MKAKGSPPAKNEIAEVKGFMPIVFIVVLTVTQI